MSNLKLIPLLVLVALFAFIVRVGDVVTQVKTSDQALSASVSAETAPAEGEKAPSVAIPSGLPDDEVAPLPANDWADPATIDMQFSETQTIVLKELKERRDGLDARETRMAQREALMLVTERRIEEKIVEMNELRSSIEDLLGVQSEAEKARMDSLIKIYSGMKPKDAATIFDNLDMDILLQVVGGMSERKSAPIIATMNVQKAQELTTLLAEQKSLPELPQ